MKESDGGIFEVGPVSDRALLLIYEAQLTELRARAEAAEAKLDDLKPLRHALEHSVSTTIHRGVVAERDKQRGMFLDAERQCEILMQQRDAAVALGKRGALELQRAEALGFDVSVAFLADARKEGWLT